MAEPADVLNALREHATDWESTVVECLAVKAGLIRKCSQCGWLRPAEDDEEEECPSCGRNVQAMADMSLNRAAAFLPARDEGELPAIRVAGVLVYGYVHSGTLRVSVDLSESELARGEETTPVRVDIGDATVFSAP